MMILIMMTKFWKQSFLSVQVFLVSYLTDYYCTNDDINNDDKVLETVFLVSATYLTDYYCTNDNINNDDKVLETMHAFFTQ